MSRAANIRRRAQQSGFSFLSQAGRDLISTVDVTNTWFDSWVSSKSYSQFGEDKVLRSLLPEHFGTYLDLGAGHPIRNSKTFLLYKLGWRGTLVEPIEELVAQCRRSRPRDNVIHGLVTSQHDKREQCQFWEFSPTEYSTIDQQRAEDLIKAGKHLKRSYEVATVPLSQLVCDVKPADAYLVSIDVEGIDFQLIEQLPWGQFLPRVICIEDTHYLKGRTQIDDLLRTVGYAIFSHHVVTSIYVHRNYFEVDGVDLDSSQL